MTRVPRCLAFATLAALSAILSPAHAAGRVWVRIALETPAVPWTVHIVAHNAPHGASGELYAGDGVAAEGAGVRPLAAGRKSPWIDLSPIVTGAATVRFLFAPFANVRAVFEVATAGADDAIVRTVRESDPGGVIALRLPADLANDRQSLLTIREDALRRYEEVKALQLSPGPLPTRIWCMTGFRSNGQFYTDPEIARIDFDIIRLLGMNGYWEQNGGQPGVLRALAAARGLNYSTVYQRNVAWPPGYDRPEGVRMDWAALDAYLDTIYTGPFPGVREGLEGLPTVITDLMDEPMGVRFTGDACQQQFRAWLQQKGFTPDFFGKRSWEEIAAYRFNWLTYYTERAAIDMTNLGARRLFYLATRFINESNARLYAMATRKVEQRDVQHRVLGTRVNFGPPWGYDYGTLPCGIDAFEFGKVRGVSLGFNEDWIGSGDRRIPLEINTLLTDWSRAALRPQRPLIGSYITRDANRATVKLRVFGCLARECKIFDFYYYGPGYTYFDPWSDNRPMVQGVGEVIRDIGQVDEILWDGRAPRANVALLYAKSWPVWKADDTEENELFMVYLALLHAGIPVDIVSDEEVADGRFASRGYRCLYAVNESIPTAAASAIAQWVHRGGCLWMSGWAGLRDEYNSPSAAWDRMLGTRDRPWQATGNLAGLGEPIKPGAWSSPSFTREVAGALPETLRFGKGQVFVAKRTVGRDYMDAARESDGALARAVLYPDGLQRRAITRGALAAGIVPPALTSKNQVLAWPLWAKDRGVVLLANFTGAPIGDGLTVRFTVPMKVRTVRSLRRGALPVRRRGRYLECTLPMADVTDILVINEAHRP